jgi:hypothetical protein
LASPIACEESEFAISDTLVAAGKHYNQRSKLYTFFWGKHYRQVWAQPVPVHYLNLQEKAGGLEPVKKGGSFQTKNLRLVNPAGKEFVIRSVDKDPTKALPVKLRKTFIGQLMRDQTSVIHPYGAFIVPALAEAAGVYHTIPELVLVPNNPALGEFQEDFAGMLALFEERPDNDQSDAANFGHSADVKSSLKMFRKLLHDQNHQVNSRHFLRARLFDMFLGDWSRRADQWRWASFEQKGKTTYKAIPRDRDHAFFKFNDGVITAVISMVKTNYQSFTPKIKHVKGLNKSARTFDETLLHFLPPEAFTEIADSLKNSLTDEVIQKALQSWPTEVYALSGKEFTQILKARRDQLPTVAARYYQILASHVRVNGTNAPEKFVIERLPANEVRITVYAIGKEEESGIKIKERLFSGNQTKTIAVYGLGGNDIIQVTGTAKNRIKLQLYDGEGEDRIHNQTQGKKARRRIKIFDSPDGNEVEAGKNAKHYKNYQPRAKEYTGTGWLLRQRLH